MTAIVEGVSARRGHHFSKTPALEIELVEGHGVAGDGHFGRTVQHRVVRRYRPHEPNLRQVHLIAEETLREAQAVGFDVHQGDLGENVLTSGLDLFGLPRGAVLRMGDAQLELTGLRNPCVQIDRFRDGLMRHFIRHGADGEVLPRIGVMAVVTAGGVVRPGDSIDLTMPALPHEPLRTV